MLLVALLWTAVLALGLPTRAVTVHVSPLVSRAPATIRVRVTVEPCEDQRILRVDAEGEDFSRASETPLAGLRGPKTTWITYSDIPAGHYQLGARVGTTSKVVATATQAFLVVGLEMQ